MLCMNPKPAKTRKAWNDSGHAHFLTYSCFQRLPLLSRDRTRGWIIDAMEATRQEQQVEIWAYVIMPEHIHLLLYPSESKYEMRHILVSLKRPVSDASRKYLQQTGNTLWLEKLTVKYPSREVFRFWQPGGGYDRNIFQEKSVPEIINYIHMNPVRRGLVESPVDWPWSSARFLSLPTSRDLMIEID